MPGVRHSLDPD